MTNQDNRLRVVSFFAGIGGFDIGLERSGMRVVAQCEIDKFCRSVLKTHWAETPLFGDIKSVMPEDLPDADVWTGGFPCQDVSLANQGKRKGLAGERSGLFFEFTRLAEAKKPKWIILENVPGLLNSNYGEDFRTVIDSLGELGYFLSWRILDAKYFGTPQRRRRVYIVGSLGDGSSSRVLFDEDSIAEVPRAGLGAKDLDAQAFPKGLGEASHFVIQHAAIGRSHAAGPGAKGFRNDGETYTLDSRGSADAVCSTTDAFRVRATPGLSKKLDSRRYRAIGNAVCVSVVEWIGTRLISVSNP
jgi:DNA (cytosine-5)-methyltransferase 1